MPMYCKHIRSAYKHVKPPKEGQREHTRVLSWVALRFRFLFPSLFLRASTWTKKNKKRSKQVSWLTDKRKNGKSYNTPYLSPSIQLYSRDAEARHAYVRVCPPNDGKSATITRKVTTLHFAGLLRKRNEQRHSGQRTTPHSIHRTSSISKSPTRLTSMWEVARCPSIAFDACSSVTGCDRDGSKEGNKEQDRRGNHVCENPTGVRVNANPMHDPKVNFCPPTIHRLRKGQWKHPSHLVSTYGNNRTHRTASSLTGNKGYANESMAKIATRKHTHTQTQPRNGKEYNIQCC